MVEVHAVSEPCTLGESPRGFAEGSVWWLDIIPGRLFRSRLADDSLAAPTVWELGEELGQIGALAPGAAGDLVLASQRGWVRFDPETAASCPIATPIAGEDDRFNDGAVDPAGRFLTGTMPLDMAAGAGQLWSLDPDGTVRLLLQDLTIPNGLVWSADGTELLHIDTPRRSIRIFAYEPGTGTLGAELRSLDLSAFPGKPDGMTQDRDGRLWVAFYGGGCVHCLDPADGRSLDCIELPTANVTAPAFVGPDNDHLLITTAAQGADDEQAGRCFLCCPGSRGHPARAWVG